MIRLAPIRPFIALLGLLVTATACGDGADSSSGEALPVGETAQTHLVPLPAAIADVICSLRASSSARQLETELGPPSERKETGGMILLSWRMDAWSADAMFSNGELQLAGANAKQTAKANQKFMKDHPGWKAGETRLEEMQAELGPGVRVGVQWLKGVDVASSLRNKPGFDRSILRDRCNDRYAWPNLDMGGFASLRFSEDGVLQGAM